MIEHAEKGSVWLGRYLDDSSSDSLPIDKILKASSLEDLKQEARIIKKKRDLFLMWCKEDPRKAT